MSDPLDVPPDTSPDVSPAEAEWRRLDPRMLVVLPLRELRPFVPIVLGVALLGGVTRGEGLGWELLTVLVPLVLGVARYLTTRYRVREGRVELRHGLLQRSLRAAQLDRVRTIDVTAGPLHRLLGVATVRIGTGAGADQDLELDGLRAAEAQQLRQALLDRVESAAAGRARAEGGDPAGTPGAAPAAPPVPDRLVLRLDPSWARYAPLTSTGFLAAVALLGVVTQAVPDSAWRLDRLPDLAPAGWGLLVLVVVGVVLGVLLSAVLGVAGYLLTHWAHTLTRTPTQWRLTRGLLTTRETSVEDARLAGVVVREPLGLRAAGAADLGAIVTGLGGEQKGRLTLVPPAPRAVVTDAAGEVLGTRAPAYAALAPHGPAARRRRWVRALGPALALLALVLLLVLLADLPAAWLLPAALPGLPAAALARDRSRALGHALADGHVVARSGSLARRREVLGVGHVIGWTVRDTWFQRRQGLVTLDATTAGGRQRVTVLDVPEAAGLALAGAATPDLLAPFVVEAGPTG